MYRERASQRAILTGLAEQAEQLCTGFRLVAQGSGHAAGDHIGFRLVRSPASHMRSVFLSDAL